jgi:hypothetical protein
VIYKKKFPEREKEKEQRESEALLARMPKTL